MKLPMQIFIALGLAIKRNAHIFFGIIAGIILGVLLHHIMPPEIANESTVGSLVYGTLDLVGKIFLRLIQMVVIPLVFSAIVIGISSMGDNKQLGAFGGKMILYYAIITVLAVVIGGVLALGVRPGEGVQSYISSQSKAEIQQTVRSELNKQGNQSIVNNIVKVIPDNPVKSVAENDILPIIVFALIFAVAFAKVGEINRPVIAFFESIFAATMKVTDWIMYLAAPGIFALVATNVSEYGLSIFGSLSKFFIVLFIGFATQLLLVYPLMLKFFSKVPVMTFYSAIAEAMMVAFGTASSSATLPLTIAGCEKRGISHKVCSFVLPLGATLNMDATALFQVVAVIFLAQAYGVVLTPFLIIQIALLAIVASSTCAGIPGAGLITIALVLNGMGLSPEQLVAGFAFLFTIERITDMFRTMLNVTSDAVVAATIADNENEINYDLLNNPAAYEEIG